MPVEFKMMDGSKYKIHDEDMPLGDFIAGYVQGKDVLELNQIIRDDEMKPVALMAQNVISMHQVPKGPPVFRATFD